MPLSGLGVGTAAGTRLIFSKRKVLLSVVTSFPSAPASKESQATRGTHAVKSHFWGEMDNRTPASRALSQRNILEAP